MPDELDDVISAIVAVVEGMTGGPVGLDRPPEMVNEGPVCVVRLDNGRFMYGAGSPCVGIHNLMADLQVPRSMLPENEASIRPYVLRMLAAVAANLQMSGTCEHCLLQTYRLMGWEYGEGTTVFRTVGIRFGLEVKILHSGVSVSA